MDRRKRSYFNGRFPRFLAFSRHPVFVVIWLVTLLSLLLLFPASSKTLAAVDSISNISVQNTGYSFSAQIAIPANNNDEIFVVWQDSSDGDSDILFAKSDDGGLTYTTTINGNPSPAINISEDLPGLSADPQLAVSSDGISIYVVWHDDSDGNDEIYFAKSADGGDSFGIPKKITDTASGANSNPIITLTDDDSRIYITWSYSSGEIDSDVYFAKSSDGGDSFSIPKNISNTISSVSFNQELEVSNNGTIYVAWEDSFDGDNDIYFAASTTGGDSFTTQAVDVSSNSGNSINPRMAATGDSSVYLVWQDVSTGNDEIYFAKSVDSGSSFSNPAINISNTDNGVSSDAAIAVSGAGVDSDNVYVAWSDDADLEPGYRDIFFVHSADAGSSYSTAENVSNNPLASLSLQIALTSDGQVVLLWNDNYAGLENDEVLLAINNGQDGEFGCPINVSNNPTSSSTPRMSIASSGGAGTSLFVIWQDLVGFDNIDILVANGLHPADPVITINDPIITQSPKWGIEEVEISGIASNFDPTTDSVTIDWGDGAESDIPMVGCSWGPVSHPYSIERAADSLNPHQVVAELVEDGNPEPKATSDSRQITVSKHSTILQLNPIPAVKAGLDLTVTGLLTDSDTGDPISDEIISFIGSGAEGDVLEATTTIEDGSFSVVSTAPLLAQENREVVAIFSGGDSYDPAVSETRTYDVADETAVQFNVAEGQNSLVNLEGFAASITFDEVIGDDGIIYASSCTAPESERFDNSLDRCISISSGVIVADASSATIEMGFSDADIPEPFSASDIDMFHEQLANDGSGATTLVDITSSRNVIDGTVSGRTSAFSKFVLGLALHGSTEKIPGVHGQQVYVGDGQTVSLRDLSNQQNSSATFAASFDATEYELNERPVLTIVDSNANVDPGEFDVIIAGVMSKSSDPDIIGVTLNETGINTGVFSGDFGLTRGESSTEDGRLHVTSRDSFTVTYISGARFQATLDGVIESGIVELSDYLVEEDVCFKPIGGAVNLQIIDAQLSPETGKISVSISYANAIVRGFEPSDFRLLQMINGEWIEITAVNPDPDLPVVTGETISSGPITIAAEPNDCGGSAGGGLGRPGTGIVIVDAIVATALTGGGGGGGGGSSRNADLTGTGEVSASGTDKSIEITLGEPTTSTTEPSTNKIVVNFENVISAGTIVVKEQKLSDLPTGTFTDLSATNRGTISIDGSSCQTAGKLYDLIPSSSLEYAGTLLVTIPYDEIMVKESAASESDVRLLHYTGQAWEDATAAIDNSTNTVTGKLDSLSPVVAAVVNDGTFGPKYFEFNPLSRIVDVHDHDSTADDDENGERDASIAVFDSMGLEVTEGAAVKVGEPIALMSTLKNLQRVSQQYDYVVEVLDSNGVVLELMYQSGELEGRETATVMQDWSAPTSEDTYTVKIFVLGGLDLPTPSLLKNSSVTTIVVATK